MPKTETITIRVSPEDKRLISNLAWAKRKSVADLLTTLAAGEMLRMREAGSLPVPESVMNEDYEFGKRWKR